MDPDGILWLSQMAMNEFYASMIMIVLDIPLFPVMCM